MEEWNGRKRKFSEQDWMLALAIIKYLLNES